ncbi:MAG TPA: radical SAM protein [Thermoplasmatales archaeon]|nr:radical SAM protein [Thermoplasmatales archaeon]
MLEVYYSILDGKEKSRYIKNKELFNSLIDEVEKIYENCQLCEHLCKINRYKKAGKCRVIETSIASNFFHYGEERMLIPSYTIFFSGCNFKCVYCQNWDISQRHVGFYIEPEKMAEMIDDAYAKAKNVNWVGGEPTPNLLYILRVLNKCSKNIPQIWNSNMYCSEKTMNILKYFIDVYLTDFKYGNNECAEKLSRVKNYWEIVTRNHKIAYRQGEIIIRHLILPNHVECCSKPVMDWISENVPHALVNIMDQYYPTYKANEYEEINRRITVEEYQEIIEYAKKLNINAL